MLPVLAEQEGSALQTNAVKTSPFRGTAQVVWAAASFHSVLKPAPAGSGGRTKQDLEEEEVLAALQWSTLPLLGRAESYGEWHRVPLPSLSRDNLKARASCCNEPCFFICV